MLFFTLLPALSSPPFLSIEYLRSVAGCRTVPVEVGSRYTDEEWSQTLLTLNDFIDRYIIKKVNIKGKEIKKREHLS